MQKKISFLAVAAMLGLTACSEGTDLERALVGAGAGCIAADLIEEGECLTGAAVGGVAGALADDV
ncbi:MAG: hypothetical protein AAGA06_03995 [Pseudomonadota bacterium]